MNFTLHCSTLAYKWFSRRVSRNLFERPPESGTYLPFSLETFRLYKKPAARLMEPCGDASYYYQRKPGEETCQATYRFLRWTALLLQS